MNESPISGLMAIVVVLVSIFPLPLDTFKRWVVSDETQIKATPRLVPCSELKVTEMWTASFPHLTSEAEVRVLDVNQDGIEDVMMGFGAGRWLLSALVIAMTLIV